MSNPLVAALLGLIAGTGIAFLNRFGASFLRPDDESGAGIGMALGMYMIGLIVAAALLFAYRAVAPTAIAPFGITLVGSMLVVTVLAMLPALREMRANVKGR